MSRLSAALVALSLTLPAAAALAADPPSFTLTIKDHVFTPSQLEVPAGQKFTLIVVNQDKSAEEFESKDLHREKIIPGGGTIRLPMGPLKPGNYTFFGEFNPKTAHGNLIAK